MSLRKTVRLLATGAFVLMLVPVVGDFFVEMARENGLYARPTQRVQAVVDWAQSIFGEQGFFWLLFALGGLAAGMWLDLILKRGEAPAADPVQRMKEKMEEIFAMMPHPSTAWDRYSSRGTDWLAELRSLHLLMLQTNFTPHPLHIDPDWQENLSAHRALLAEVLPFLRANHINEAHAVNLFAVNRITREFGDIENAPIYERPTLFRRLLGAKPKLLSPPDTGPETQP